MRERPKTGHIGTVQGLEDQSQDRRTKTKPTPKEITPLKTLALALYLPMYKALTIAMTLSLLMYHTLLPLIYVLSLSLLIV